MISTPRDIRLDRDGNIKSVSFEDSCFAGDYIVFRPQEDILEIGILDQSVDETAPLSLVNLSLDDAREVLSALEEIIIEMEEKE